MLTHVASAQQAPYLACLQVLRLAIRPRSDLRKILKKHTKLFDGTLGDYSHRKFHIDLVPEVIAKHARPYPVPVIHLSAFKQELLHLVKIGVFSPQGVSK